MPSLLAVDMGLRTGLALHGSDGRLIWYRSQHYGNRNQLRRAIHGLLATIPELAAGHRGWRLDRRPLGA